MTALIHKIALDGYSDMGHELTPEECWEVAEFCLTQRKEGSDLRVFCDAALPAALQYKLGDLPIHWSDYVLSWISGEASVAEYEGRDDKMERHRHIACKIALEASSLKDRLNLWRERADEGHKGGTKRSGWGSGIGTEKARSGKPESQKRPRDEHLDLE